jgi:hypothetical protein
MTLCAFSRREKGRETVRPKIYTNVSIQYEEQILLERKNDIQRNTEKEVLIPSASVSEHKSYFFSKIK